MKNLIPLTAIAALAVSGISSAQTPAYSKPSGYETLTLAPGFNFIGVRLAEGSVLSGSFTTRTETTLTSAGIDFSALNADQVYLLEFGETGALSGMVMELFGSSFSSDTITGLSALDDSYLAPFQIRPATTLAGLFGSGADLLLDKGTVSTADTVFLPKDGGGFDVFYHSNDSQPFPGAPITPGKWLKLGSSDDQSTAPINYIDGLYVRVRGTEKQLVVTGQVRTTATLLPGVQGISYFSSLYPAGATLDTSKLADQVQKGTLGTADLIYMPQTGGGFDIFFHSADSQPFPGAPITIGTWQKVGESGDQADALFASGFIFLRRGTSANLNVDPPSFYNDL